MLVDRRVFLKLGGTALLGMAAPGIRQAFAQATPEPTRKADYTIEIANGLAELGPQQIVSTTLYNGQFPGPLLRFKEGQPVTVDIVNRTDHPELLHWHGQKIRSDVDSANCVKALANYGEQHKGVVKTFVAPSVAPDRLWRLGNRIPAARWSVRAGSRLQILEKSAAKASIRPIPPLSAPPEVPDCPTTSSCRRPV